MMVTRCAHTDTQNCQLLDHSQCCNTLDLYEVREACTVNIVNIVLHHSMNFNTAVFSRVTAPSTDVFTVNNDLKIFFTLTSYQLFKANWHLKHSFLLFSCESQSLMHGFRKSLYLMHTAKCFGDVMHCKPVPTYKRCS